MKCDVLVINFVYQLHLLFRIPKKDHSITVAPGREQKAKTFF